jgi:H+-transporting ATPase
MTAASEPVADLAKAPATEAVKGLQSNADTGLAQAEATARLKQYGYNEVPERKANPFIQFAKKFWGLTSWMIELIIVLSWILHKYPDVVIVSALLVVNAILSFAQEQRASGAVEALRHKLQVAARVLRDGVWKVTAARELVPGDIVRVRPGDFVPADVKIIAGDLGVDQSALTGESMEVEKRADDVLYSGSIVRRGEATCVAILTGVSTYYGRTTELVQIARPRLHIEEVVSQVVRWLLLIVGALLSLTLIVSVLRGVQLLEILPLMLVLLLAAIPVALPVMFTVSMAVGAMELARRGVLVTRLSAAEDAATMNVLCVDKTGTVTMNKLSMAEVIPLHGFTEQQVILYGALASQEANQDPIDLAFIQTARQRRLINDSFAVKTFVPFDPQTRRTEAVVQQDGREFRTMKGAVRSIAQACGLDEGAIGELEATSSELAMKGHRTLAVARADDQGQPRLVGLATLYDAPRPDSKALIAELKGLGIAVKMLTGDALPIAREVAAEVGLGENVSRVAELEELAKANPVGAAELAEKSDGFAEIYPEGKYTVVKSLQGRGHVIGMTGDGVNDAPALRQAEVGIAVSNATDVAKGAASVVLTAEGLSNIVALVENGRRIYQRIVTWVVNKISRTILKSSFVVLAFLVTGKYVISAFGMILVVFMTDFAKISLSTDNVRWSQKPDRWNVAGLVRVAAILGLLMVAESFGLLYIGFKYFGLNADIEALQTFTFEILLYFAIFSLFVVRERRHFWDSMPSKTLLSVLTLDAIIGMIVATVGIPGMKPIPFTQTLAVIGYAFAFSLVVNDLIKFILVKETGISW